MPSVYAFFFFVHLGNITGKLFYRYEERKKKIYDHNNDFDIKIGSMFFMVTFLFSSPADIGRYRCNSDVAISYLRFHH